MIIRLNAFSKELSSDVENREQLERRSKLKTMCETRWSSRADALYTFKMQFVPVFVHALDTLQDHGDDKAGMYLAAILRFQFIITLVVTEYILSNTLALATIFTETGLWSVRGNITVKGNR